MKFLRIVSKNMKLLTRAKSSGFIVIFGPLLNILLVGLALNNPSSYEISVGYYTPDVNNALTDSFIREVQGSNYLVLEYDSNESCIDSIKQGTSHTCIIFPKDFEIGNNLANKVEFYVDYSRANIVYQIIEAISSKLKIKTSELSQDLTETLLDRIDSAKEDIDTNILSIITLKTSVDSTLLSVESTKKKANSLNLSTESISLTKVKNAEEDIYDGAQSLKVKGLEAVSDGKSAANNLNDSSLYDDFSSLENDIEELSNTSTDNHDLFGELIDNTTSKISDLVNRVKTAKKDNQEVSSNLYSLKNNIEGLKTSANEIKTTL